MNSVLLHFQDTEDTAGRADREDSGEQEHTQTVAAQERVCGWEDADQLVHIPSVQIFKGQISFSALAPPSLAHILQLHTLGFFYFFF